MEIEEEDGVAVFGGKGEDGAAQGFVAGIFFEGGCGGEAWVRRLGDFVEGERHGGHAAELGSVDVGGEREKPGGEGGVAAKAGEFAESAEEGFLGHFFGSAAVAAKALGKIDEGRLPAADDAFEGGGVTGDYASDESFVFGAGQGRADSRVLDHMQPF